MHNLQQSTSIYASFCRELAKSFREIDLNGECVLVQDIDRYDTIYEIARKSAPSCFSKANKTKYESDILQLLLNKPIHDFARKQKN